MCLFILFNFIDGIETHSWKVLIQCIVLDCARKCTMKIILGHLDIFMSMSVETRHANTVSAKIYLFVQLYLYLTSLCKLYKKYSHEENKSTWCTHFMQKMIMHNNTQFSEICQTKWMLWSNNLNSKACLTINVISHHN